LDLDLIGSLDPYLESKKEIREEISCSFWRVGGFFVVWKFFMEA
jgi:hypothetical protein